MPESWRWMLYPSTRGFVGPNITEVTEVVPVGEVERLRRERLASARRIAELEAEVVRLQEAADA